MSEAKEPRTEAGKRMDIWSSGKVPIRDLGFDSARDAIRAIEEQAATEADLRLLAMTTARDAAVVEADRIREAATEARRELDVDVLAKALMAAQGVYTTYYGSGSQKADRQAYVKAASMVAAEYRRLTAENDRG